MFKRFSRNPFVAIEARFKLRRTDSDHDAAGVHAVGSYHYIVGPWGTKEARDYGTSLNSDAQLQAVGALFRDLAKAGKSYRGYRIREVFGPFNYYVKDGIVHSGRYPGHGDHVHIALSK